MSTSSIASTIVLATGVFWGVYWFPVRAIADLGLDGAWGTGAVALAAMMFLLPLAIAKKDVLRLADPLGTASVLLGGAAFAMYSIGFLYGEVALVILLWFFSPVWSVLIAKYLLRWHVPKLRLLAIAVGLSGLFIMLGGDGGPPAPRNLGEWMAFFGGFLWAWATAGMRLKSTLPPAPAAFMFAIGAAIASFAFAPILEPIPSVSAQDRLPLVINVLLVGGIWWGLSIAALMWATVLLDPARVGILLMTEVVVGAVSAAIFVGETLSTHELIGGALVLLCGLLEVWPVKRDGIPIGKQTTAE